MSKILTLKENSLEIKSRLFFISNQENKKTHFGKAGAA